MAFVVSVNKPTTVSPLLRQERDRRQRRMFLIRPIMPSSTTRHRMYENNMDNNGDYPPYYFDNNDRRRDGPPSHHDNNDDARYNDNGFHSLRDDCPRPRDPYVSSPRDSSPSDFTYGPGSSVTNERRAEEEIDRQYRDMENSGILPTNSNGIIDDPYAPAPSRRYNAPEGMLTEQGGGHNYYTDDIIPPQPLIDHRESTIPPQPLIDRRESTTAKCHDDVRNKRSFQYGPKSSVALDSGVSIDTSSSDQAVDRTRYRKNDNVGRMMPPPLNINHDERMIPPPHSNDRMIPPPPSDQVQARYRENGMNIDDDERMIHPPLSNDRMVPPHPNDRMNPPHPNDRMNPPHPNDRMNPPHPNDRMNPPLKNHHDGMNPPLRSHHDNDRTIPPPSSNDRTMPPPNGNIEDDYHRGRDTRMEDPVRRERPRMMNDIDDDYRRHDPRMEDPIRRERERPGMMDVDDTTTFHRRTPSNNHHDNNRRRNNSNEHIGEPYVRRTNNDDNNNSRRSMNYDNRQQRQYNNNDDDDRRRSTSSFKHNSYNNQKNNNKKDVIIDEDDNNDNNFGDVLQKDIEILQRVVSESMNSKIPEVLKSALDAKEQINELVALQRLNLERSICKLESRIESMELSPSKIDACTELQHMQRQLQELSSANDIDDMPFNDNGNRMSRQNLDNGEDDYHYYNDPERRRMRMNEDRPSPRSRFKDIDIEVDDYNYDRRNDPSGGRQRDTSRPSGRGRKDDTRKHHRDVDTDGSHPYDPVISIRNGNTTFTRPLSAPPFQYGPGSSIASAQAELDYGAVEHEHKEGEDEDRVRVRDNLFIYDINDDDDSTIITTTSSYDDDDDDDEDPLDKDDDDDILRTRLREDDDIDSLMAKRRKKRKQRCD